MGDTGFIGGFYFVGLGLEVISHNLEIIYKRGAESPQSGPASRGFRDTNFIELVVTKVVVLMFRVLDRLENQRVLVRFEFEPIISVTHVAVCGTFNNWNRNADKLLESEHQGVFQADLEIPVGQHQYKFLLNHSVWKHDATNPDTSDDGHGGSNSVLDLSVVDLDLGPIHDPDSLVHASVTTKGLLSLRVSFPARVEDVCVVGQCGSEEFSACCEYVDTIRNRCHWQLLYPATDLSSDRINYRFEWFADGERQRFPERGQFSLVLSQKSLFNPPKWVESARFYQIFPDRFYRSNDEKLFQGLRALKFRPRGRTFRVKDAYLERWGDKPGHFNFFGGDLNGIREKLGYLEDLGVNALYLNPIFKAWSNHRYDAADYKAIDPRLGTIQDFRDLCQSARDRGIRVILDAAFNHTGHRHWAFMDVIKNGRRSRYWSWYFVDGFPIRRKPKPNYRCWWDFPDLPQLNTANPEVVEYLMDVAIYWLEQGASGWRLDVPNEVHEINPGFWPEFRRRVKAHNAENYIVGEIWHDPEQWISDELYDATMNYPLRRAILDFFVSESCDAEALRTRTLEQQLGIPAAALHHQFNLLGSHDTARLATLARGHQRKLMAIFGFLYCYPGAPVLYYADETGMRGQKDPDCRRCFPWNELDCSSNIRIWVKSLNALRAENRALESGSFQWLYARQRIACYRRQLSGESEIRFMVNAGPDSGVVAAEELRMPGEYEVLLQSGKVRVAAGEVRFGPYSVMVLRVNPGCKSRRISNS